MYFQSMAPADVPQTPEQIMLPLALRGEPSAFHSLFGHATLGIYTTLRQQGPEVQKAQDQLCSFVTRLYRSITIDVPQNPRHWFESQCRRRLKLDSEALWDSPIPHDFPPEELDDIDSRLQRLVQREYSRARSSRGRVGRVLSTSAAVVKRNPLLRFLSSVVLLALMVAVVEFYLRVTDSSFLMSLDTRDFRAEFSMPVSANSVRIINAAFSGAAPQPVPVPDSAATADSTPVESAR